MIVLIEFNGQRGEGSDFTSIIDLNKTSKEFRDFVKQKRKEDEREHVMLDNYDETEFFNESLEGADVFPPCCIEDWIIVWEAY